MMEAVRTSETSVDNHSTWQYNPEDSSEQGISLAVNDGGWLVTIDFVLQKSDPALNLLIILLILSSAKCLSLSHPSLM
jgi:hypothetical protein